MLRKESQVRELYETITRVLMEKRLTAATMESCTGGLLASLLTDTEGASAVIRGGLVTYCNEEKLRGGVAPEIISRYGVYSEQTAEAMAKACQAAFGCDVAIAITGTFGNPDPNNPDSREDQIHFALLRGEQLQVCTQALRPQTSRFAYKLAAAEAVGQVLLEILS